jgi:rubrerythrin
VSLKEFSPSEAFDCALKSETAAAEFYEAIAGKAGNPAVQEKFKSLARDEREHYSILERAREEMLGALDKPLPDPSGGCKVEVPVELKPDQLKDVQSVIEAAIQAEEFAAAFYNRAAEVSKDPGTAEIFSRLAAMEVGHKRELQEELDFLGNDQFYWLRGSTDQRSMEY